MSTSNKKKSKVISFRADLAKVQPSDVDAALQVIEAYGRKRYDASARDKVSRGQCIGLALASRMDCSEVVDAAIAELEDWNGHLSCAALRAIEKGEGQVIRLPRSRDLHIVLPKWWAEVA